jgi:hypothetical protein
MGNVQHKPTQRRAAMPEHKPTQSPATTPVRPLGIQFQFLSPQWIRVGLNTWLGPLLVYLNTNRIAFIHAKNLDDLEVNIRVEPDAKARRTYYNVGARASSLVFGGQGRGSGYFFVTALRDQTGALVYYFGCLYQERAWQMRLVMHMYPPDVNEKTISTRAQTLDAECEFGRDGPLGPQTWVDTNTRAPLDFLAMTIVV